MPDQDPRGATRFGLLGPFSVEVGGVPVELGRRESRVLAALALDAGHVVATERLLEIVWGEDELPARPLASLQVHVSHLRRLLDVPRAGVRLDHREPGYVLRLDGSVRDVDEFVAQRQRGRSAIASGRVADGARDLRAALALWRGPALQGLRDAIALEAAGEALDDDRAACMEEEADARLVLGQHERLVADLRRAVAQNPLREGLSSRLMLALYRAGRQSEALAVYQRLRAQLERELGISPSPELRRLQVAVLQQDPDLEWRQAPRPPSAGSAASADRPLVGRAVETGQLGAAWDRTVREGSQQVVLVQGPAGIGKTALLAHLARQVERTAGQALYGACDPEQAVPFQAFIAPLQRLVLAAGADLPEALGGLEADLARLVPLPSTTPAVAAAWSDPVDVQRFRLLEAALRLVVQRCTSLPLALVLDDLHWADAGSLAMLRHVVAGTTSQPVLVVLAAREAPDQLARLVGAAERVDLGPLDEQAVRLLASGRVPPGQSLPGDVAQAIASTSGGVPLFAVELVRHVLGPQNAVAAGRPAAPGLPPSLHAVARQRVAVLDDAGLALLRVAAVLGGDVEIRILAEVATMTEDEVVASLDQAVRVSLLVEAGPADTVRFEHELVRQYLYDTTSGALRLRLHARAADALESSARGLPAAIARHRLAAAAVLPPALLARSVTLAARHALLSTAAEEAAALTDRALHALAADGQFRREHPALLAELLLVRGQGLGALGRGDEAQQALEDAVGLAAEAGAPALVGTVVLARHELGHVVGPDPQTLRVLRRALSQVPSDQPDVRARCLQALAFELVQAGQTGGALAALDEAERLGDARPDRPRSAALLNLRHLALLGTATAVPERLVLADAALAAARGVDDVLAEGRAHLAALTDLLALGDLTALDTAVERYAASRAVRLVPAHRWRALVVQAAAAQARGDLAGGEQLAETALSLGSAGGVREAGPAHLTHVLVTRWLQGRPHQMAMLLDERLVEAGLPLWRATAALVCALVGDLPAAQAHLSQVRQGDFTRLSQDWAWLPTSAMCAQACATLAAASESTGSVQPHEQAAKELYDALVPYDGRLVVAASAVTTLGPVERYLGLLAVALGRRSEGQRHLAHAREQAAVSGLRAWTAQLDDDLSRTRTGMGAPQGDGPGRAASHR